MTQVVPVCLVGLIAGGTSGIPRYASALTSALDEVAGEFPQLSLQLLTTPAVGERIALRAVELRTVAGGVRGTKDGPRRILAEQLAARSAAARLLHFFDLTGPLLAPRRRFTATLHDAAIRQGFQNLRVAHKQILQPLAIKRARAIVAVSDFARDEAVRRFSADPARIHVIHSGPGLAPYGPRGSGPQAAGTGVPPGLPAAGGRYLLCVGNLAAHKNLPFLVRAFAAADVEARLLLVGTWGDRADDVRAAIDASPARDRIELCSGVSDAALDRLYRGAEALLLPSLYEGFGFTALEAMRRDCPVLASDIPALREVCRDGAILLSPTEDPAWTQAIRTILADPAKQTALRRRGSAVVAGYSWEKTARRVCELLLAAGGGAA